MKKYDHKQIEKKWQEEWAKSRIYEADDKSQKKKFYPLVEFPFPSGSGLHTGHIRSYTAMDVVARKHRMQGENVLYPIGWDAFGLPTENYAIQTGKQPKLVTRENTDNFRKQLKSLGISFDWSREVNTTDPEYFKWTQWIFLKMYERGLAYKAKSVINWCPKDKIGLANEEVVNGKCDRCGSTVEKREKEQWMLAITKYADRLYDDLDTVDYLERIKTQQRNWIGRSEGAELDFAVKGTAEKIKVFTTRPDTLFGVTYVVLAPEHELVSKLKLKNEREIRAYIKSAKKKNDIERTDAKKEKTGMKLDGVFAINPANREEISIFVADYVLADYGTGAVMAVPAHDERDWEFAKKYKLSIREVIEPLFIKKSGSDGIRDNEPLIERDAVVCVVKHWRDDSYLCLKWKKNDWQGFVVGGKEKNENIAKSGAREIQEETGYKNTRFIRKITNIHSQFYHEIKKQNRFAHFEVLYYELADGDRDSISDEESILHEVVWEEKNNATKLVAHDEDMKYIWEYFLDQVPYTGEGILTNSGKFSGKASIDIKKSITEFAGGKWVTKYKLRDWIFSRQRYWGEPIPMIHCEKCGWVPAPERDLPVELPAVKKYEPTETGESPLASISKWVNVKCPKCGAVARRETDTMPNWAGSSWYYLRYIDPHNKKAIVDKKKLEYWTPIDWYNGGMEHTTLHLLYSRFWHKFLFDIGIVNTNEPYQKRTSHGLVLAEGGEKMSKSKGTVVNPDELVETYGADTLRLYEMFMGPFDQAISWDSKSLIGPRRFIERVFMFGKKISTAKETFEKDVVLSKEYQSLLQRTIQKVTGDIENMGFNTAVSSLMILSNSFEKEETIPKTDFETFLKVLAPFAPHICEELWHNLGNKKSIHISEWPMVDESKIIKDAITIVVQVNGKVRANFKSVRGTIRENLEKTALNLPDLKKWLAGKKPEKIIVIQDKLVSIVVR